ncbi:helix-turn-helix domain-containing protein [Pediococcus claussenii]|uniref:helix-turn-helix domain-containing protein n=1 Tax=Pediococcus claussenii TaxID=187452 RepID=UPI00081A6D15|nr:helix-turn-helix transcriptional regulator [Pediococcus claussenii]ANZ70358.1 hypothetical protein AYR57_08535 [Pediococcus claussenii]ANZ72174.1 hypothetical protein AYR58_08535 [Pediococcus claussenii]
MTDEKQLVRQRAGILMDEGKMEEAGELLKSIERNIPDDSKHRHSQDFLQGIVGVRIRELMAEYKTTEYDLVRETQIPKSTFEYMLSGRTANPSYQNIIKLADFFGVSTDYFRR